MVLDILDHATVPVALLPGNADVPRPYNVSAGQALADVPLVHAALTLLQLALPEPPLEDLGAALRSPFLAGADAEQAAEYARRALTATRVCTLGPRPVTASAGIATAHDGADGADELFRLADEQILAAKSCGKNRVAVSADALARI
jgi:GGDEF domain-containing protein